MIRKNLPFLTVLILTLGIDIFTKYLIRTNFYLHESQRVIDGFFSLTYVLNPGAIFGFLSGMNDDYRRWFFVIISLIAAIIIIYMILKENGILAKLSLTLILSGALGNMIDRLHTGFVVDFLDFYMNNYHWYTFNFADVCITSGITLMILDILINKRVK